MEPLRHLDLLLDGTPLALERTEYAWPGLSTSERAHLLVTLLEGTPKSVPPVRWRHQRTRLIKLGLADQNAYVRYLAAKHVEAPYKLETAEMTPDYIARKALVEQVRADPALLVRSAHAEYKKLFTEGLDDPQSFWKRPQVERLALVNGVHGKGDKIASILRYATATLLPDEQVTVEEMLDVLLQYVVDGRTIAERVAEAESDARGSYDGFGEYLAGASVRALWEAIPDIPEALADVLIDSLPAKAGFEFDVPEGVVQSLDEQQLERLLYRDDVPLEELRRRLWTESASDSLRAAAISSQHFSLLDSDITNLIHDPAESVESRKQKVAELVRLARGCRGATLVQLSAICDLIKDAPKEFLSSRWEAIEHARNHQTRRAKRLKRLGLDDLQRELAEMRLYKLAKLLAWQDEAAMVPDLTKVHDPEKLKANSALIIRGDAWKTYVNFSKANLDRTFVRALPQAEIPDFVIPESASEQDKSEGNDGPHVFDLARDVQASVDGVSDRDRAELSALSKALSAVYSHVGRATKEQFEHAERIAQKLGSIITVAVLLSAVSLVILLLRSR